MPTWTPLTAETVAAWADLTNLLAEVDDTDEYYDAEDLAEELSEHGFDPELDSWAAWEGDQLVAFGQLRVSPELTADGDARADLTGGVHPQWRRRGIGTDLLARMEARAVALAAERHPGAPVLLRAEGRKEGSDARPLLAAHGYEPARYFTDMRRDLPGEPLGSTDPRVRPYSPELAEAVRLAHNDAFSTHWGSTSQSPERWADIVGARSFRADDSRVILGDDGIVLAYVLCGEWVDRELYISLLGTRRSARGQGLARAVLQATVADAGASGRYDVVELGVDSANPTGADALYVSVGFTPIRTQATYTKRP